MLESLHISAYALIDDLTVNFKKGLNIFTGATGAGKTIIVGALSLVTGGKGGENLIRSGDSKAVVEAEFGVCDYVRKAIPEFAGEDRIILRREMTRDGKNRASINGRQVTLGQLKTIGSALVNITGQHQQKGLLDTTTHRTILDDFAGLHKDVDRLKSLYLEFRRLKADLDNLKMKQAAIEAERELLSFQIDEIDSAGLTENEDENLEREKQRLVHAEAAKSIISSCRQLLFEDAGSAAERIAQAVRELARLTKMIPSAENLKSELEKQSYELEEFDNGLSRIEKTCDPDPDRLEIVEERLALIKKLKRKYGQTIEEIGDFRNRAAARLNELNDSAGNLMEIEKRLDSVRRSMSVLAAQLSAERQAAAGRLEKETARNLAELSMAGCEFKVKISQQDDSEGDFLIDDKRYAGDSGGVDSVEFLICANPGEGLKPLAATASGGELSRILLAICSSLSQTYPVDTMVFDEIDSGISGEVASSVARKLLKLAQDRQVICVTHLQQIASRGEAHFRVFKGKAKGRSVTRIKLLDENERIAEIARLLSGERISDISLKGAAALLEEGGSQI